MTTPEPAPGRSYHHGDLRLALIERAEDWMKRTGSWGFTLRELARDLGVSHNAPYKHFEDKQALLVALGERAFARLAQRLDLEMSRPEADDIESLIEAAAVGYVGYALQEPAAFRLMFGSELADCDEVSFRAAADGSFGRLRGIIAKGVQTGHLRPDIHGLHAASAWSLVHGLSLLLIDGRLGGMQSPNDADSVTRALARTLLRGLQR